jgi:hypothetical protein
VRQLFGVLSCVFDKLRCATGKKSCATLIYIYYERKDCIHRCSLL